jgi:hypothetical protein
MLYFYLLFALLIVSKDSAEIISPQSNWQQWKTTAPQSYGS